MDLDVNPPLKLTNIIPNLKKKIAIFFQLKNINKIGPRSKKFENPWCIINIQFGIL